MNETCAVTEGPQLATFALIRGVIFRYEAELVVAATNSVLFV